MGWVHFERVKRARHGGFGVHLAMLVLVFIS
jgi:hypothetical protein